MPLEEERLSCPRTLSLRIWLPRSILYKGVECAGREMPGSGLVLGDGRWTVVEPGLVSGARRVILGPGLVSGAGFEMPGEGLAFCGGRWTVAEPGLVSGAGRVISGPGLVSGTGRETPGLGIVGLDCS